MRAALIALALASCAAGEKPVAEFGVDGCDAKAAVRLVGRIADEKLVTDAKRLTHSRTARVVAPGTMVTMDYRTNRVNLSVDDRRVVTKVSCG